MSNSSGSSTHSSPKQQTHPMDRIFQSLQDKIISALEVLLPSGYDFSELEEIYNQCGDYSIFIVRLLEYFIKVVGTQIGRVQNDYLGLQRQTQKLEADIRNHIAISEALKIELNNKLRSVEKYKRQANNYKLRVDELSSMLSYTNLSGLSQPKKSERQSSVPLHIRQFEHVLRYEESPVKRAEVIRRPLNRQLLKEEDENESFRHSKYYQFNPEVSNYRYHSVES